MTDIPQDSRTWVALRDFARCVRCKTSCDPGEWHHRRSRSVRDHHQHHPCNGILLCSTCHRWVHAHPFEARAQGWIVSRHVTDPGSQPVFAEQHGWVLLDCDGNIAPATNPQEEE